MTRTAFLDRDGTLNREIGFFADPQRLELLPGARDAVRRLHAAGFRVVVTTNQSGVARGHLDERQLAAIHRRLHAQLDGIPLAYLHCPHLPPRQLPADEAARAVAGYVVDCACRKPGAGLLHEAESLLAPFGVSLRSANVVVGDSARDLLMARGLPFQKVLVASGKPIDEQRAKLAAAGAPADHEAADLLAAVDWLLER
ncbi:MAG: HAD-IIIA family hydrolase [Planctomycetes bacterium]|nr:HAD-IIIA family hydrolase [Planctomycetota bacterium]